MRDQLIKALLAHAQGDIQKHVANVATDVQQRIYGHQLNSWIIGEVTHI